MLINFNLRGAKSYQEVQQQLNGLVQAQLHLSEFTESKNERLKECLNFSWFLRSDTDVVMSHGVADKSYFWMRNEDGDCYVNKLRAIIVPGQWLKRRLLASKHIQLSDDQIRIGGWPRLDLLRSLQESVHVEPTSSSINVLWAPTHDKRRRGDAALSTSSYPEFKQDAKRLAKLYKFNESLHPHNRRGKAPTVNQLLSANVVVSDFGTMVYEAWALGKPVIFPRWILKDRIQTYLPHSAEATIFEQKIGYHADSYDEMIDMLKAGPVVTTDVSRFMTDYLDNYREGSAAACVAAHLRQLSGA